MQLDGLGTDQLYVKVYIRCFPFVILVVIVGVVFLAAMMISERSALGARFAVRCLNYKVHV